MSDRSNCSVTEPDTNTQTREMGANHEFHQNCISLAAWHIVLFCLLAMFGVLALFSLPLELQPSGDRPEITVLLYQGLDQH